MSTVLLVLGGLWKRLLAALSALWDAACKHPREAAIVVLLCVCAWLIWHGRHVANDRDMWHRAYTLQKQAGEDAAKAQKAENSRIQVTYRGDATNAENDHAQSHNRVRAAADRFVLAGGVRPALCPSSSSDPAAQASDPTVPAQVPADSVVATTGLDVQRCSDATDYAVGAFKLLAEWRAKGLAEPGR